MAAPTKWNLNHIWNRFTAPSVAIEDLEQQRRARVLASFLILVLPLNCMGIAIVYWLRIPQIINLEFLLVLLSVAYFFSRTQYIMLATFLTIVIFTVFPFLLILNRTDVNPRLANEYLVWLAAPILISGLVFSVRHTIMISGVIVMGLLIFILLLPPLSFEKNGSAFGFVWTIAVLVILLAVVYYQNLAQLKKQLVERQRIEERLRASVAEKEVLLREIHHRVKNNLQVISSLLSLQAGYVTHEATVTMIRDSQYRIRSMALVHEQLYRSSSLAEIDFAAYVQQLVEHLQYSYMHSDIQMTTHLDAALFDLDTAMSCGLIINELVSNAFKHAFPEERKGQIHVKFQMGNTDQHTLIVEDDGVGISEIVDLQTADSLGLQLVNSLVQQLEGTLELSRVSGTTFTIRFVAPGVHRGKHNND